MAISRPAYPPFSARPVSVVDIVHTVHNYGVMSTAYISGRVPARYGRLVARQARAARTSKSDLVARYVIEKSLETEYPGISFRDSLSGREAYLTGHRVAILGGRGHPRRDEVDREDRRALSLAAGARDTRSRLRQSVSRGGSRIA